MTTFPNWDCESRIPRPLCPRTRCLDSCHWGGWGVLPAARMNRRESVPRAPASAVTCGHVSYNSRGRYLQSFDGSRGPPFPPPPTTPRWAAAALHVAGGALGPPAGGREGAARPAHGRWHPPLRPAEGAVSPLGFLLSGFFVNRIPHIPGFFVCTAPGDMVRVGFGVWVSDMARVMTRVCLIRVRAALIHTVHV